MSKPAVMEAKASYASVRKALYLSHFTPSMMPPETLEAMLVQREPMLKRCVASVVNSVTSASRHHHLFVGPRGIGKTHLIALLHHRLSQNKAVQSKALIAWMREEEWGVTSFFELVLRVLRTLGQSYPELKIEECTRPLYELSLAEAENQATTILLGLLGKRTLVILLENLDDLFQQLGDMGQKQWRGFIQNHPQFVLVTTTPSLFSGVSAQKSAFYGFFDIEMLKELDFEQVVELLEKIAIGRGDQTLAEFILTSQGKARIRAVHHLAEGNPRIYIIFAQFLTQSALDELVQAFMHTLDELTPYYQARMRELSAQQRKIMEYLIHNRLSAPVKQIAKACFITHQVCSSQLKQLREKRYVRSIEQGRESYYELCEPLMRLCMDVKNQRGEPIGLFVEFLRIWYSQPELEALLIDDGVPRRIGLAYIEKAIALMASDKSDPKVLAIERDLDNASKNGRSESVFALLSELKAIDELRGNVAWIRYGVRLLEHPMTLQNLATSMKVIRGYANAASALTQIALSSIKRLGNQSPEHKALIELATEIDMRSRHLGATLEKRREKLIHAN